MDFKTFLEHFDTIAQAPNGIAKLRSLILDLAVRGKLVPQNSEDEPVEFLIKKAQIEKKDLFSKGRLRKEELYSFVEQEESLYNLPQGWQWVRLGEVINCLDHLRKPVNKEERLSRKGNIPYYGANGQVGWIDDHIFDEPLVLVVEDETFIGRQLPFCYRVDGKSWVNNHAHVLQPTSVIDLDFLNYALSYYPFAALTSGTTGRRKLTKSTLLTIPFPFPPLNEQKRIVEKVDELMALCDRLQASQETRDNLRQNLRKSAIASLMNAETDEELQKSWSIVRDNWQTLSQKPEDVGDLRRSILSLAVQGKLVKQNSGDGSASATLKKSKTKDKVKLEHLPFKIPQTWRWVCLGEVSEHCLGKMLDKQKNKGIPLPYLRNLNVRWLTFDLSDVLEMPFEEHELERFGVEIGDVLICEGGEPGRAAIWEGEIPNIKFQKAIHRVRPFEGLYNRFLVYCLLIDAKTKRLETYFTGATFKHFTGQELAKYLLPLPPLAEQKRIVAKVDELMQVCDRLEESLRQSQQWVEALAASAISHLTV